MGINVDRDARILRLCARTPGGRGALQVDFAISPHRHPLAPTFADATPLPMVAGIAACAAISLTVGYLTLKGKWLAMPSPAAA